MFDELFPGTIDQLNKLTIKQMNNSSTVLREMTELRKSWRLQGLTFTKEQKARYDELVGLRRAFVTYWNENGMVV